MIGLQTASPAIPAKTMRQAEKTAGYILAKTGVTVKWGDRGAIRLRIGDEPLLGHSLDAVGFAFTSLGDSNYAEISYPAVEAAAASLQTDPAELLGAAVAHEVGHLLLGPAHSLAGVMTAHFRGREAELVGRGELLFDTAQAIRIRSLVGTRRGADTLSAASALVP
jgi:hypothetical protein